MDLSAFIADFFDEARERLTSINEGLVAFENESLSDDGLVQLRRDAHTIKGSALMLGVNDLGGVAHLFEDAMEYLIDHKQHRVDAIIQFLFDLHDLMETRMQDAKAEGDLPAKDLRRQYDVLLDQVQCGEMAGSDSNNSNDNDDYVDDSSSMDMGGIDLSEFTSAFFDEARGLLSKINELLVSFELEQLDDDDLVELRRNAHTIKGSALMLGIQDIGDIGHLFENAMEKIIENPKYRTSDMVQYLFDLHDHLSERIEDSETPTSKLTIHKLRADYEQLLADTISNITSDDNITTTATVTEVVETESNDVDDFLSGNDAMGGIDLSEFTAAFFDEARELLAGINELLVDFENEQLDSEGLIQLRRNAHTIKGSALMLGVNDVGNVGHLFEDAMEHIIDNAEHRTPEMVQFLFDLHDKLEVRLADPDQSEKLSAAPLRVEYEELLLNISTETSNTNQDDLSQDTDIVEIEIEQEDLSLGLDSDVDVEDIEITSIEETPATVLGGEMFGGDFNMGEFINAFYDEARELLDEIKPLLHTFASTGLDDHELMILRRNAHTIRGSALMLGLQDIGDVGQLFEDTMAYLIEHPEFQCLDVIKFLVILQTQLYTRIINPNDNTLLAARELRQDYARLMRRVSSELDASKNKAQAEEQARRQAAAKAKAQAEEQARRHAAAKAKAQAEEQARRQAAAKAKAQAEEQTRRQAAAKAKAQAEEQARRQAAAKAKAQAKEQARRQAAAKAKAQAEEQTRRQAAAKAKAQAEEQARRHAAAKAKAQAKEKQKHPVIKEKIHSGIAKKDSSSVGMDIFLGNMFSALQDEEPKDYPDVLIQPLEKLFSSKKEEDKKPLTAAHMFKPSQTQEVKHFDFAAPTHEDSATDAIKTTPTVRKPLTKIKSKSEDFISPKVTKKSSGKMEAAPEDMLSAFDAGDSKQKTIKSSRKVSKATAAPAPKVTDLAPDDLLAAFDAGSTDYNKVVEQTKLHTKTTTKDESKTSVKIDLDKIQNLSLDQFDNDIEPDAEKEKQMDFRPDVSQMTMRSGQRTSSGRFLRVDAERLNSLSNQVVELSMEKAQGENLGLQFRELVRDLNGLMQQWQQFSSRIDNFASVDQRKSVIENIDNVFLQRVKTAKRFVDELQHEHGKRGLMLDGLRDQVLGLMLRPLDSIFSTFPRAVRDAAKRYKKKVRLVVSGESVELDQSVAERLVEPMVHLLNNSIAHGVEMPDVRKKNGKRPDGQITIVALQNGSEVRIDIFDDGGGIDAEKVKRVAVEKGVTTQREADDMSIAEALEMIFRPGFSTHDKVDMMAGRGIGMNVVQDTLRKLTGNIRIHTEIGRGTCFTITLPVSIAVQQGLLFRIGSQRLGILAHLVDQVIMLHMQKITKTKGGKKSISYKNHTVPLVDLRQVFADEDINDDHGLVVVAKHIEGFVGIVIDELIDEMEVVVRDLDPYIKRYQVPGLMGTTIIGDGSVVLLIEPYGIKEMGRTAPDQSLTSEVVGTITRTLHVLLAEDSMIARQIEKKLLVDAGFTVDTAIDGMDAVEKMRRHEYDLLITDLEMPRLDGFGLVRQVRAESKYADLPILVISTRESAKDRLRSLEAGADAYLIKQSLQQGYMLETIESLVGPLTMGGDDINQTLAELNQ
ncbi:MAG: Hpt domain-containing protein [Mariprofundales bacterium]